MNQNSSKILPLRAEYKSEITFSEEEKYFFQKIQLSDGKEITVKINYENALKPEEIANLKVTLAPIIEKAVRIAIAYRLGDKYQKIVFNNDTMERHRVDKIKTKKNIDFNTLLEEREKHIKEKYQENPQKIKEKLRLLETACHTEFKTKKSSLPDIKPSKVRKTLMKLIAEGMQSIKIHPSLSFLYKKQLTRKIKGIWTHFDIKNSPQVCAFDVMPRLPQDSPFTETQMKRIDELKTQHDDIKNLSEKKSRLEFTPENWATLDTLSFELVQEHFLDLCDAFNNGTFKNRQDEFNKQGINYHEAMIAEVLAKSLAFIEGLNGKAIKVPILDENNRYQLVEFKIQEVNLGEGLPTYLLTPSEGEKTSPWVVIRGSEVNAGRKGSFNSVLTDVNPDLTEEAITSFIKNHPIPGSTEEIKVKLAGYSLGGTAVTDLATRKLEKIEKCYAFSPTGLTSKEAKKRLHANKETLNEKIVSILPEGDLVPSVGQLVGKHIAYKDDVQKDPITRHLSYSLNQQKCSFANVDVKKENKRSVRKLANAARLTSGLFLRFF